MRRAALLALLLLSACAPRPDGCALLGGAYRYCAVAGAGPSFEAEYASAISARGRFRYYHGFVRKAASWIWRCCHRSARPCCRRGCATAG
jgi:hypothetical protein